jgi:hypothetical protein
MRLRNRAQLTVVSERSRTRSKAPASVEPVTAFAEDLTALVKL